MSSKGTLISDDKVLFDGGFKKATAALGRTETVVLKGKSHKIITTSASKEHDPSESTTAIYSTNKVTIGGQDHTDCDKVEARANEVSGTTALNDRQYISLLTTIAQNKTDNLQYPLISNKFLEKMIQTHNQYAPTSSCPAITCHWKNPDDQNNSKHRDET